jgi:hypothetical protein
MSLEASLDIAVLAFSILVLIASISLAISVVIYREYEFNRLWRSRVFLLTAVALFTITLSLSNLHWFPQQIRSEDGRRITCGVLSFFAHCFFFPLFAATLVGFLRSVSDSSALLSVHANRLIVCHSFRCSLPIILLGLANVFIAWFAPSISFFSTYREARGYCVESSYYSLLGAGFSAAMFAMLLPVTGLCCAGNDAESPRLNVTHRARVRALPFGLIPFILLYGVSTSQPYAGQTSLLILKHTAFVGLLVFVFVYLYYFVFVPIRETSLFPLLRGTLTMRHGEFADASRAEVLIEESSDLANTRP